MDLQSDGKYAPNARGWIDRVRFSAPLGGFAYRPGELLTTDPGAVVEFLRRRDGESADPTTKEVGSFTLVTYSSEGDAASSEDTTLLNIADLRQAGIDAQPNHVFFADCLAGCGCGGCPPHPSVRCGPGASPAYASPAYASPAYASPAYASPAYASPAYASPAYASPAYASPAYASPAYASGHQQYAQATGLRRSSARPVTAEAAEAVATRLADVTERVKAREAEGHAGPKVVVLDTGLASGQDLRPDALPASVSPGVDSADRPDTDPANDLLDAAAGHGTFIGGLIVRVAPTAQVEVHQVIRGLGDVDEADVVATMATLFGGGDTIDIVNLSFSGYALDQPAALASAVREAQRKGAVVVASAGNDARCQPTYPAALPGVIGVGAIGPDGAAPFTNFGPWVRACAPGVNLVSTFFKEFKGAEPPAGGPGTDPDDFEAWARWSGTSFAAPLVAGALAREMADGASAADAVARIVDGPNLLRIPDLGTVVNVA